MPRFLRGLRTLASTNAADKVDGMGHSLDTRTTFFMGYWPGEGGAQPLRLGTPAALAVWDSHEAAELYGLRNRMVLQVVEVSAERLEASGEALALNP